MSVIEGLPFGEDKKGYIVDVLDPVLEELVSDILTEMPGDPVDFMIAWLRKRSGVATGASSIGQENSQLRKSLKKVTMSLEEAGSVVKDEEKDEEEEEDDSDDCDEIPYSHLQSEACASRGRPSVSAEAYGQWNRKMAFTAPEYPKTDEQKKRLKSVLLGSFMFSRLEAQDLETILMAMKEVGFEPGAKVIREGEDGDNLFVIEKGSLDCIKVIDGKEQVVKTCTESEVFGELALLYNCPRAATVVAKDKCVCWQLDRETFGHIVRDSAAKRMKRHDAFLKEVALISSISPYERSQIAEALVAEMFQSGDTIVKQGQPGDKFYILEQGELFATKETNEGPKRVMNYKPGDYFGELALLKNQPRAASVVVESDTARVLSLSRLAFNKMLGPLQDMLARQTASYS